MARVAGFRRGGGRVAPHGYLLHGGRGAGRKRQEVGMSGPIAVLVAAAVIVAGGYGLYKISFERGYVQGYEDASVGLMLDDNEGE